MSETFGIRIPPKTPLISKAELKVDLAKFVARNEHFEWDCSAEIHVWKEQDVAELLLHCIAEHEPLCNKEKSTLRDITQKVARSKDFIVCLCEAVKGLVATPLPHVQDPLIIDFYSFIFHRQTWAHTGMSGWPDTFNFEINDDEVFCLVRDINSPDLRDYNDELKRLGGRDAFTLCTPAKEYDMSQKDTQSWRNYLCTPWPFDKEKDDVNIYNVKWDLTTPTINNSTDTYKALLRHLDEMNDYKNRLRSEVGRLTIALAKANKRVRNLESNANATETSSPK